MEESAFETIARAYRQARILDPTLPDEREVLLHTITNVRGLRDKYEDIEHPECKRCDEMLIDLEALLGVQF